MLFRAKKLPVSIRIFFGGSSPLDALSAVDVVMVTTLRLPATRNGEKENATLVWCSRLSIGKGGQKA